MTIEDFRQKYNIQEEITPQLEEQIKKEHSYLFQGIFPGQD